MKTQLHILVTAALFIQTGTISKAFAWGDYGHEQINHAALELIEGTPIGKCLKKSSDAVVRLSITPDYDWKKVGRPPSDRELAAQRAHIDKFEHPLHYFEADSYVRDAETNPADIAKLPTGEFQEVVGKYRKLLSKNLDYVRELDPKKAPADADHVTDDTVAAHGTAPWRVLQLYDLGVKALREHDFDEAILYLGAMGHYVGDLGQPFHVTMNFDGQHYTSPAGGIHATFESKIFKRAMGSTKKDAETGIWTDFHATETGVMSVGALQYKKLDELTRDDVLSSLFKLAFESYTYTFPLLKSFAESCSGGTTVRPLAEIDDNEDAEDTQPTKRAKMGRGRAVASGDDGGGPATDGGACVIPESKRGQEHASARVPAAVEKDFMNAPGVMEAAKQRMGASAALLGKLWVSAYVTAGKPSLQDCGEYEFKELDAIGSYPLPTYLNQ
jgi:hypothetical protein